MTVAIIIYLSVGLVLSFLAILIHKLQNGGKITTGDEIYDKIYLEGYNAGYSKGYDDGYYFGEDL